MSRKLLFISTPVGFLGSGGGGGVELTLYNLARTLTKQGYPVRVVAPEASQLHDIPLITIAGNAQISAQSQGRQAPILMPENAVLANMWHYAQQIQNQYVFCHSRRPFSQHGFRFFGDGSYYSKNLQQFSPFTRFSHRHPSRNFLPLSPNS